MMTAGTLDRDSLYAAALHQYRLAYWRSYAAMAAVVAIVLATFGHVGVFDAERLLDGIPSIASLIGEMMPPGFERWRDWGKPLLDTLGMSIAGTALALALSLPLGMLSARNISPHAVLYHASRLILNFLRAIPELIMGIVFVAAVGFGALPGVLALGLHSVGMIGKFFAEAIEHADPAPIEAIRAAGGSSFQVITHGVMPQVLSQFIDVALYRWEHNFRASTVMGMVGAGGIGFELIGSLRIMQYQEVSAILIVILVMVTAVDSLSSRLRKHFK